MRVEWVTEPDDPRVEVGARLGTTYWRDVLGPGEPPYPEAELVFELTAAPSLVETRLALIVADGDTVAAALLRLPQSQRISAWVAWLVVVPDARRQGVGRALFDAVASAVRDDGRARLGWKTASTVQTGAAFSRSVGATHDETLEHNRLATADVDRGLLTTWVDRARERAGDYSLVGWDGPCPDELLVPYARLQTVMDEAPGVQADLVVAQTPESIRGGERRWLQRGPYWRLCARHDPTGELVGFTELQVPTTRPAIGDQGDTAVRPAHRERGIGRWLKAVNMLRIVDTAPSVLFVDTINAASNDPMIHINRAMGFRPVLQWHRWELRSG